MRTSDLVVLRLPSNWVGQIVDGLSVLLEDWEATERFMETGRADEGQVIRECDGPREARSIAAFYREIIDAIVEQIP